MSRLFYPDYKSWVVVEPIGCALLNMELKEDVDVEQLLGYVVRPCKTCVQVEDSVKGLKQASWSIFVSGLRNIVFLREILYVHKFSKISILPNVVSGILVVSIFLFL